jgi:hypothetical protein
MSKRNKGRKNRQKGMWKRIERIRTHLPGGGLRPEPLLCRKCERAVEWNAAGLLCLQCERYQKREENS